MTVCIAALSEGGKQIVCASDSKIAFGGFSADKATLKAIPFVYPWMVLLAGNDVAHAPAVINRARNIIVKGRRETGHTPLAPDVAEILFDELLEERSRIIEASVLRQYGFTCESFRDTGKDLCTESTYNDLIYRIAQKELSLQFLLCGFDDEPAKEEGQIWLIQTDMPPQNYEDVGFWAIGTGAQAAISSLAHSVEYHGLSKQSPSVRVAYHALEAKFMAESASDVGRETSMIIVRRDANLNYMGDYGVEMVRKIWKRKGAPRVPPKIDDTIETLLYAYDQKRERDEQEHAAKEKTAAK